MHFTWWDAVQQLPPSHRFVSHEPETPRYARARQKLRFLIREGVYLGMRLVVGDNVEIAIWAPPDSGRGPGFYACFRLFVDDRVTTGATLFCFYDGTESSPGFSSASEAQAFAQDNGFSKDIQDGIQD